MSDAWKARICSFLGGHFSYFRHDVHYKQTQYICTLYIQNVDSTNTEQQNKLGTVSDKLLEAKIDLTGLTSPPVSEVV